MNKVSSWVPFLVFALFSVMGIFVPLVTDFDGSKVYNWADITLTTRTQIGCYNSSVLGGLG